MGRLLLCVGRHLAALASRDGSVDRTEQDRTGHDTYNKETRQAAKGDGPWCSLGASYTGGWAAAAGTGVLCTGGGGAASGKGAGRLGVPTGRVPHARGANMLACLRMGKGTVGVPQERYQCGEGGRLANRLRVGSGEEVGTGRADRGGKGQGRL